MASSNAVKVLFSGSPATAGAEALMKKVEAANKKVGADALFCVGQFFAPGNAAADPGDWIVSVVTGEQAVPVPTYFIGGYGEGCGAILDALPASDAKLKYLGRAGVTRVTGLTVAFLDGTYNAAAYHAPPSSSSGASAQQQYSPYYSQQDVHQLKRALQQLDGEVDVLLTCEWPRNVAAGVPEHLVPEGLPAQLSRVGSTIVEEIAALARPRYHFAGGLDMHFARLPYVNADLGAGPRATRFVGLADMDSPSKAKSLHALALVPSSEMDPEALSAIPEGSTPSPYDQQRGAKRQAQEQALPDGQDWRWSMKRGRGRGGPGGRGGGERGGRGGGPFEAPAPIVGRTDIARDPYCMVTARNVPFRATHAEIVNFFSQAGKVVDVVRGANAEGRLNTWLTVQFDSREAAGKAVKLHNSQFQGREITVEPATSTGRKPVGKPGQAVEGCWFCLGSESVDLSLVASVGEEAYLALDKGQITEHHVLVVSVDHYPSAASLPPACYAEVQRYLSALRSYYAASGKELVAFERYLTLKKSGGNHCHINAIGISPAAAKQAEQVFQQAAQAAGFQLTLLPAAKDSALDTAHAISQSALQEAVGECEYFLALLPDGKRLVRPIMRDEKWPINLGRQILAQLAGCPERADWKLCSLGSSEEEQRRTDTFKAAFSAFDIMR